MVICLQQGADLQMAQLMPLPLTVCCSVKSRLFFFPFWYRPTRVVPDKGPLNRCVCVCALYSIHLITRCVLYGNINFVFSTVTALMCRKETAHSLTHSTVSVSVNSTTVTTATLVSLTEKQDCIKYFQNLRRDFFIKASLLSVASKSRVQCTWATLHRD